MKQLVLPSGKVTFLPSVLSDVAAVVVRIITVGIVVVLVVTVVISAEQDITLDIEG